jgi:hypothetical protein
MTWLRFNCEDLEEFKETFESLLSITISYDLSHFDDAMQCDILDDFEIVLSDEYGFNFNDYDEVTI